MSRFGRYSIILGLTTVAILASAATASASVNLTINISGLAFQYDELINDNSGSLFDAPAIEGRQGIGSATPVGTVQFLRDGQLVGELNGLYVDFLMTGIHNIRKSGTTSFVTPSTGDPDVGQFGFDLLSSTGQPLLQLNLNSVNGKYLNGGVRILAGGTSASVVSQALPFQLMLDEGASISVSISSSSLSEKHYDSTNTYVTAFTASGGAGVVSGIAHAPEPTCCFAVLLGIGVIGMELQTYIRRRRQGHSRTRC